MRLTRITPTCTSNAPTRPTPPSAARSAVGLVITSDLLCPSGRRIPPLLRAAAAAASPPVGGKPTAASARSIVVLVFCARCLRCGWASSDRERSRRNEQRPGWKERWMKNEWGSTETWCKEIERQLLNAIERRVELNSRIEILEGELSAKMSQTSSPPGGGGRPAPARACSTVGLLFPGRCLRYTYI